MLSVESPSFGLVGEAVHRAKPHRGVGASCTQQGVFGLKIWAFSERLEAAP